MKLTYLLKPILLAAVLLVTASGCSENYLNLSPPTTIPVAEYFKTQSDINAALNGAYGGLRGYYGTFYVMAEVPTDNTESNSRADSFIGDFDRYSWVVNNGTISDRWSSSYDIISRCNILIEKSEAVTMDAALKARYQAEAKFLRALMYFNLVRFFGDVPIVLTEIKTEAEAYTYNREPVTKVYAQIEKDLLEAATVLPVSYTGTDVGRATKGAAQALLGSMYLTSKQFDKAVTKLNEVISANTYKLLPVYEDVFRANNGNNAEIVFSVQYTRTGNKEGSNFSIDFAPTGAGSDIVTGGNPASLNQGTLDLFNAFEPGDLRKNVSIQQFTGGNMPYYTRKFLDQPPTANESDNDWPVIRYSDVLLMYAEALNETGNTTDALTPLNQVRSRAGLPAKTDLSQADFRLAVEQERRVELCFEGHRWFDLIRTGRLVPVITAYIAKYRTSGGYQVGNYQFNANKALYPIPFRETSLNPNLTQNPGY
ncbi:RagB/SusD family nutrient uptake outer membrane protein [Spirosoma sp. SC4-14]|uniref:RagB/SusD family nutrient uptake outer membrane protein n=1 Tax=Spirosoma sp. SC4-14 TaxID=3128900 RepID=UPI0030D233DB